MPQMTKKINPVIHLNVKEILHEANTYIFENSRFTLCVFAVNMVYMLCFKCLEGGISNPLSILWLISYYIFWCFFYRYYYNLHPYFGGKAVIGSLAPSAKALVILFLLAITVAFLPMLPLFLGFDDVYLDIYERYLSTFDGMSSKGAKTGASIWQILAAYGVLCLVSPMLICKPYLAWISSLRGKNSSFRKVKDRAKGNYWSFVIITALLLIPEATASQLDKMWNCRSWLDYTVSTIVFVYTNIIFAKIYDLFYLKH
ncbi:MAG: hypothetical protein IJ532_03535 [Alphaproteobacteria bacterium]|nr:hypothetical protein [Alphaproteobacteria bacterium]